MLNSPGHVVIRQPERAESALAPGRATKYGLYLLTYTCFVLKV